MELSIIDPGELDAVLGGFSWKLLGRSAIAGFLDGGSQSVKGGQSFLQGALRGGIMGLAQGVTGQIGADQAPQAQPPQGQPPQGQPPAQ